MQFTNSSPSIREETCRPRSFFKHDLVRDRRCNFGTKILLFVIRGFALILFALSNEGSGAPVGSTSSGAEFVYAGIRVNGGGLAGFRLDPASGKLIEVPGSPVDATCARNIQEKMFDYSDVSIRPRCRSCFCASLAVSKTAKPRPANCRQTSKPMPRFAPSNQLFHDPALTLRTEKSSSNSQMSLSRSRTKDLRCFNQILAGPEQKRFR